MLFFSFSFFPHLPLCPHLPIPSISAFLQGHGICPMTPMPTTCMGVGSQMALLFFFLPMVFVLPWTFGAGSRVEDRHCIQDAASRESKKYLAKVSGYCSTAVPKYFLTATSNSSIGFRQGWGARKCEQGSDKVHGSWHPGPTTSPASAHPGGRRHRPLAGRAGWGVWFSQKREKGTVVHVLFRTLFHLIQLPQTGFPPISW